MEFDSGALTLNDGLPRLCREGRLFRSRQLALRRNTRDQSLLKATKQFR